jgi:phage terminase large subunit
MELHNGSTISFIGADAADRLGSIELTYGFIDEASELSEESLGMIQGRLSGQLVLPPNIDQLPENIQAYLKSTLDIRQVVLACNPKSTNHYLYKRFIDEPQPGHVVYNSNSISNPNLPVVYLVNNLSAYVKPGVTRDWILEQVRKVRAGLVDASGLYLKDYLTPFGQRNLLGLWVALEGAIYDLDEAFHVVDQPPTEWGPVTNYVAGIDFGFHNPRLAIFSEHKVVLNGQLQSAYLFVHGWHQKGATGDDLILKLKELDEKYHLQAAYLPHDQPGLKKIARKTLGSSRIKSAKTAVSAGIHVTSRFLNSGRLKLLRSAPDYDLAWGELGGYQWKPDGEGGYLDQPIKQNDHHPDAFRYMIYSRHFKDEAQAVKQDQLQAPEQPGNLLSTLDFYAGYESGPGY